MVMARQARQTRRVDRGKLGKLKDLVIARSTKIRYDKAMERFFSWQEANGRQLDDMGTLAVDYIETLWEEGDPRSWAGDLLSGLQHSIPMLKGMLGEAWRLVRAWQKHEIPSRAPPLLRVLVQAMAQLCIEDGNNRLAAALLLAFEVYLRTGEMLRLACKDIMFHPHGRSAVIDLGLTKAGKRNGAPESVLLEESWLVTFLMLVTEDLEPRDPVIKESPPAFRVIFNELLKRLGLEAFKFRPYSLRRGGATAAYRAGVPLTRVAMKGRWNHQQTLKIYVNDGWSELQEMGIPHGTLMSCKALSKKLEATLK